MSGLEQEGKGKNLCPHFERSEKGEEGAGPDHSVGSMKGN